MSSSLGHFPTEFSVTETHHSPPPRVLTQQTLATASLKGPLHVRSANDPEEATDSEAETIVFADPERKRRNGEGSPDRGRGRGGTEDDEWEESDDRSARRSKRHRKRRDTDAYSSELSSAPSAPSSPVRDSSHQRDDRNDSPPLRSGHHTSGSSRKRKAPGDIDHANGNSRARSAYSPKRTARSSPYSPSPPPFHRTKAAQASLSPIKHRVKQRKVPRPLSSLRDKRSSEDRSPSSSRQGSPSNFSNLPRHSAARTPGSPVNMINMPHKPKRDASGRTLLHRAAQRGNLEEVMTIYHQNNELLNAEDNAGYIPLHEASLCGNTNVVRFLLSVGSWVDVQSTQELDTPLMDAVENGHLEVVRLLLEKGADPKKRNKSGADALECLAEDTPDSTAIEEAIRAALQKRRSKRSSDDENNRNSATIDSHSSRDPSVTSPVHNTAPQNSRQISRRRNARADQTKNEMLWVEGGKNGLQKLREKARLGDTEIVHACLERGVQPDVESLIGAIKGGHDDTVSLLLAFSANADPEPSRSTSTGKKNSEETPMLAAIGRNNLKILEYLLDKVDPLRKDARGRTYMDIARERMGDNWEKEVEMLQTACDRALAQPSSEPKKADKPKKKFESAENSTVKRTRPRRDSIASARTHRRSESLQSKKEEISSDRESTAEPKIFQKDHRTREPDPVVKKKRRLVPVKELLAERNQSSTLKSQEHRSSISHDIKVNDSRNSQPAKLKSEPKDVEMLDIPEMKNNKRDLSELTFATTALRTGNEKSLTKEAIVGKKRNKETDGTLTTKALAPGATDPGKRKRKIGSEELKDREDITARKMRKSLEIGHGRPKDTRRDGLRTKGLDSESRSEASGKEDDNKKMAKDHELSRSKRTVKDEGKRKRSAEEIAERAQRKKKEAEFKDREELEQQEEERARKAQEEKERLRITHLSFEQEAIIRKALEYSRRGREADQKRLEQIAEERRLAEQKRIEMELEEKRRQEGEEEKRRLAEEEERRLRLEEEARANAAAEEKLQKEIREAAERRRLEEEAEIQRQLEQQRLEEEARRLEEEELERRRILEEEHRRAEIQRREALPFALRAAAENPKIPSVDEAASFLPLYIERTEGVNVGPLPNGDADTKACEWVLNVQAALVLGINDLSFQECKRIFPFNNERGYTNFILDQIETRDISDTHKLRIWMLIRPMLSKPITFDSTNEELFKDQLVNKDKFLRMDSLFWMKV